MDLSLPGTSLKNKKIFEGDQEVTIEALDRISKFPDEILCHILSFLPTKCAAQTGILSKRWKDLWVSVTTLDFDMHLWSNYEGEQSSFDRFAKPKIESFTNFVDRLLAIRGNLSIKKFRLAIGHSIDSRYINTWMCAVHNVEELDLEIWELGEFPWSLFVGNSLVILKLNGDILLNIPSTVSFPSLKILRLDSVTYVDDASIDKLLSSCPVLEDLQIYRGNWDNVRNFVISVPSLKRLTLDFIVHEMELYNEDDSEDILECKLFVDAPNLEYLRMVDYMSDCIVVSYMPHVTESHLAVYKISETNIRTEEQMCNYGSNVYGIFQSIPNVKYLTVGDFTLVSLWEAYDRSLPIFHNLVHLELVFDGVFEAMLLPTLLEISPKLESLILPRGIALPWEQGFDRELNQHFYYSWKPPEHVPECFLFCLKNVEIRNFLGKLEDELKLVQYFLENAMVLEKMTIFYVKLVVSGGPWDNTSDPTACQLDDRSAFRDEMMNYTRGSAACQLDIQIVPSPT